MYEIACVGVLLRYRVAFLCLFTKQFKQKSTLKELLRPRLVGTGDSAGISAAFRLNRAVRLVRLLEYGPPPSSAGILNPENRYIANASKRPLIEKNFEKRYVTIFAHGVIFFVVLGGCQFLAPFM